MEQFLACTDYIDWQHPAVRERAILLSVGIPDKTQYAKTCFEWVRDHIRHTGDYQEDTITCRASDVLLKETGYCYAKSHLLAALLRANNIPTGMCYQRLSRDENGPPFCLHGLNAVYLEEFGWLRIDPRGNKPGVHAEFCPPTEKLAFSIKVPGEADLPEIWPEPLPIVVDALENYQRHSDVWANLPDIQLIK